MQRIRNRVVYNDREFYDLVHQMFYHSLKGSFSGTG